MVLMLQIIPIYRNYLCPVQPLSYNLNRRQLKHMVAGILNLQAERKAGASSDNVDVLCIGLLKAWQINELRADILKLFEK